MERRPEAGVRDHQPTVSVTRGRRAVPLPGCPSPTTPPSSVAVTTASCGGLPRTCRLARRRPRAPPRAGRRRRHGGDRPGLPVLVASYVVSLLRPEIIRDLDLPRHGLHILPARRHVHAARRRLPVAHQRPRGTRCASCAAGPPRRRGVRRVRPADGRDRALHQALLGMVPPDLGELDPRGRRSRSRASRARSRRCRDGSSPRSCSS